MVENRVFLHIKIIKFSRRSNPRIATSLIEATEN